MDTVDLDYSFKRRETVSNKAELVSFKQVVASITAWVGKSKLNDVAYHATETVELPLTGIAKGTALLIESSTPINIYLGPVATTTPVTANRVILFGDEDQYFTEVHIGNNLKVDTTADVEYFIGGDPVT